VAAAVPDPDPTTEASVTEADEDAALAADDAADAAAAEGQARLWLRAVTVSAEMLGKTPEAATVDCRVRYAVDMALVAACERIGRLCRSDLLGP
jgi:hypothetical protein